MISAFFWQLQDQESQVIGLLSLLELYTKLPQVH